jgi:plastocyanin domain-containing protein
MNRTGLSARLAAVAALALSTYAIPSLASPPAGSEVAVRVDEKGFTPSHVNVEKGKPLTLIFTRTSDDTCARDAVFPDLGIKKPLPKDTPVRIELPTTDARTFTFQCGMGMYKSNVVVR